MCTRGGRQIFINENSIAATLHLVGALTHLFERRKPMTALETTRQAADKVRPHRTPP